MYFYIYKITCTEGSLKDHYYYGQHRTNNLDDGYKGSGRLIRDYYKKHPDGYLKEIIAFYNSKSELDEAESKIISDKYDNDDMCLNLRAGGISPGMSNKTRERISAANKGRIHSVESRKHMSEGHKGISPANKGKHHTLEARLKMSESLKGRVSPNKGKHFSTEVRKNISEGHKGQNAWNKGIPCSEESKRKNSEAHKRENLSEETRRRMSAARKGKEPVNKGIPSSEESKRKNSEAHKGKHRVWNEDHTHYHYE